MKKSKYTYSFWVRILVPLAILVSWLGVAGVGGPYFGRIEEVSDIDLAAFLPASAESTKVNNELSKFRDSKSTPAIIVFTDKDNGDIASQSDDIDTAVAASLDKIGSNDEVSPAIVSEDKKAVLVTLGISSDKNLKEEVTLLKENLDKQKPDDLNYQVTGPAGFARDLNTAFAGIDGLLLLVALAVVFVILLLVYRSPILPFIVLMTSMVALTAAILIVWNLANADIIKLNGQVQGILFILVIGAATDYSLLYVARYREELLHVPHRIAATKRALKGAFEPILASGGTVIAGLLCLLASDLSSNNALGPVGSIGVLMAILSALTFLPAALALAGRWAFWPFKPKYDPKFATASPETLHGKFWPRVAKFVKKSPRAIWVSCVAVLALASLYAPMLKADGVQQSDLIIGTSEARDGQKTLNKHFPGGSGSPVLLLAPANSQDAVVKALENDASVESVSAATKEHPSGQLPLGSTRDDIRNEIKMQVEAEQKKSLAETREGIAAENPAGVDQIMQSIEAQLPSVDSIVDKAYPFTGVKPAEADGLILLQATLKDSPDSQGAKDAVFRIRETVDQVDTAILVGGITAIQLDTNAASIRDRTIIIPLVLLAITVILMGLLRSILAPILLLLTTIISFTATLGISAFLFQDILKVPGMDPSVVLYGFVFLVALGIDYNIFLMTRVREETLKIGTRRGVLKGLVVTGGVITSAGVVLAATFAALGVIPILFLLQLAFIVAFGVLLDTIIVRSLLVPALIYDIGPKVWWPSKQK